MANHTAIPKLTENDLRDPLRPLRLCGKSNVFLMRRPCIHEANAQGSFRFPSKFGVRCSQCSTRPGKASATTDVRGSSSRPIIRQRLHLLPEARQQKTEAVQHTCRPRQDTCGARQNTCGAAQHGRGARQPACRPLQSTRGARQQACGALQTTCGARQNTCGARQHTPGSSSNRPGSTPERTSERPERPRSTPESTKPVPNPSRPPPDRSRSMTASTGSITARTGSATAATSLPPASPPGETAHTPARTARGKYPALFTSMFNVGRSMFDVHSAVPSTCRLLQHQPNRLLFKVAVTSSRSSYCLSPVQSSANACAWANTKAIASSCPSGGYLYFLKSCRIRIRILAHTLSRNCQKCLWRLAAACCPRHRISAAPR
jgi:hypothetical protein